MLSTLSPRLRAILEALFVTFVWSTSWVLIKIGLDDVPALTFAGLRYTLAFLILLPIAWRRGDLRTLRGTSREVWGRLIALGLVYYAITQGTQFLTLVYLPAVTFSLLLNFSAVIVAVLGIVTLRERPAPLQWLGMAVFSGGVLVYFTPVDLPGGQVLGLMIAAISVTANAVAALLGRGVNRAGGLSPMAVTVASMGVGSVLLLAAGVITQGLPPLSLQSWGIVVVLAVVNTAFAFTLWNRTLQTLTATESSIINNTMLIQIAVLAWVFLGEHITLKEGIGLAIAAAGILLVQIRRQRAVPAPATAHTREREI